MGITNEADQIRDEARRLEAIAQDSWYSKGVNADTIRHSARIFRRHFRGLKCLELGPGEGLMTETLLADFDHVTVVEGSGALAAAIRSRFPSAHVVESLFESFNPEDQFDTIVLGHVLEHVENPRQILSSVREWLTPDGVVCAAVPNARSLHRQAAVLMGVLREENALNETDVHHGHRRVYDPESFRADFLAAGLVIDVFGGYWIKPLSNAQIEATWDDRMIDAFMRLGERYPDVAGELYIIARR